MRLWSFYSRLSPAVLTAAVCFGLLSGLSAAGLLAIINHAIQLGRTTTGLVVFFISVCLLRLGSGIAAHILMIRLSQSALRNLRVELGLTALRSRLDHLERVGRSRLAASFGDDVIHVAQVVVNVPYFMVNLVVLLGCLVYLGWMSTVVLVGFLVCAVLGVLSYLGPVILANRWLRTAREHEGELFGHFDQALEGIKELKLHTPRRHAFVNQLLRPAADAVRRLNVRGITLYASAANWNRLLFFLYVGLLVWAAPIWQGGNAVDAVQLAGYVVVLLYLMAPLEAVMNTLPHLARADVALSKLDDLVRDLAGQADEVDNEEIQTALITPERVLALEGICYEYPDSPEDKPFTLGPVDLILRPGELLFLVGGNGAGKTTLLKLITGLYRPSAGSVKIDGQALNPAQRGGYRNLFSAIFSEFHVFPQLLGHDINQLDERAGELLDTLGLRHKVRIRDGRLSTVDLSRGQRKRLALLVALLEDRTCYVFDEWAADQSPEFREVFYSQILPRLAAQGKAVVVATHDDRYFHLADRLVKLDEGRLVNIETRSKPASATHILTSDAESSNGHTEASDSTRV